MTEVVGRSPKDARLITEHYRDAKNIVSEGFLPDQRIYLREADVGVVQGQAPANSTNNTVNSSYRTDDTGGTFQYTGVVNPWSVEVAGSTVVFLQRIMTGQWVIVSADCEAS